MTFPLDQTIMRHGRYPNMIPMATELITTGETSDMRTSMMITLTLGREKELRTGSM